MKTPEYIFETSWEVCNHIGGIYTVLSTRAASMQKVYRDHVFLVGPDVWHENNCPYFKEVKSLLKEWKKQALKEGLHVRVGRWTIPGSPIAILVDYNDFWEQKNSIYRHFWEVYGVNSLPAYGDYDESSLFGYAAGKTMESLYRFLHLEEHAVVAHFNEWMTSFGLFYIREALPQVGTLFTTHATSIGRSIAGNNKPLYDYFLGYHGDQMAEELNMVAKHSTEKRAAWEADCFTTVSQITNKECQQLLDKAADIVTPNGFEGEFVPQTDSLFARKKNAARRRLKEVAEQVLGFPIKENTQFVCTSGRYEWKNKGIDVYLHALKRIKEQNNSDKDIVAFLFVPAWQRGIQDPARRTDNMTTHILYNPQGDPIMHTLQYLAIRNREEDKVKVIFVPSFLDENDGVFNMSYYDVLIGMDITVFPSYYEPWGYTPLESIAFHIPTITTDLSGFGRWVKPYSEQIADGVEVIHRTDSNWQEVVSNVANTICAYLSLPVDAQKEARSKANAIALKASWKEFFRYYQQAYHIALTKAEERRK